MRPLLVLVAALAACQSPTGTPRRMYDAVLTDLGSPAAGGFDMQVLARQEKRFETIVQWVEEGELESAEDFLYSAGALCESDHREHLELAHDLALHAAELGDQRGFTMQAYATDKLLVDEAAAYQRYGTVFVYRPALEKYELYPIDPLTTDTERRAMGVPPLAELLTEVDEMNASPVARRLRGELVRREDDTQHTLPVATED